MKRRAISPILAVIVLMGVATVGGGILYGVQSQFMVAGLSTLDLRITDIHLEKDSNGACYFQSNFYNSGTQSIADIRLKATLDNGEDFTRTINELGQGLVPGNSTEYFEFIPSTNIECNNFSESTTYSVFVNATSSESKFSTITSLKVENVTKT